ncbi:MAG: ATP-binding protein [Desmonostoc vinosum HA7617-LM4]|jgi:ABC-type transport system involved in cytochrome c biogenesis ATPase subunit|nr:ATP-binding protein [Desmonostoc vinosum HA7617-LM4]
MKINQVTYYDHELEWRFEPIKFSEFNLLVGVSGVGKTQILKSIINLKKIARGASLNGVEWNVIFTANNYEYKWSGEFETKRKNKIVYVEDKGNKEFENEKSKINQEYLYINEKLIIERHENDIKFNGNKLPKLSPFQSAVEILSEEEDIAPVKNSFNKVTYSDNSKDISISFDNLLNSVFQNKTVNDKYSSLDKIQETNLPILSKLALVYNHNQDIYQKIKEHFINIFEYVEDIKIEPDDDENLPEIMLDYPIIKIKEKGVSNWITQERISSGMMRTLIHISELYLSSEGTVILIDEFENSLGVNCIDVLSDLLFDNRELQFIITSHHPYIINKVEMEHWKIISRKGGVVTARDATDFNLGKSKHQAFIQLINLDAYKEGIAVG